MYQRILVPIDGSPTASAGLAEAIQLAKLTGAQLRLINVIDPLVFASGFESLGGYSADMFALLKEGSAKVLADAKTLAQAAGVEVQTQSIEGLAARVSDVVADQVRSWKADLVVIGTHGRRGVGRLVLGSDAEQIVRSATVPVLLVRSPEGAAAA